MTIGQTDLLIVERQGENIENVAVAQSTKPINRFTKQIDKSNVSSKSIVSNIPDKSKDNNKYRQSKQPESNGSRSRSRVRYERTSRHEGRNDEIRERNQHCVRKRSKDRRRSEERKHKHEDRRTESGHERTVRRDRYDETQSNSRRRSEDRTHNNEERKTESGHERAVKHVRYEAASKQDIHKCLEKDSVQITIRDARDIIAMKRARESNSDDRFV